MRRKERLYRFLSFKGRKREKRGIREKQEERREEEKKRRKRRDRKELSLERRKRTEKERRERQRRRRKERREKEKDLSPPSLYRTTKKKEKQKIKMSLRASAREALFLNLGNESCHREAKRSEAERSENGSPVSLSHLQGVFPALYNKWRLIWAPFFYPKQSWANESPG